MAEIRMNPIESLNASIQHALLIWLAWSNGARPNIEQCQVDLFQAWSADTTRPVPGQTHTVVITGPAGDVCVYFNGKPAYRIQKPNDNLARDLANRRMRHPNDAASYEMAAYFSSQS